MKTTAITQPEVRSASAAWCSLTNIMTLSASARAVPVVSRVYRGRQMTATLYTTMTETGRGAVWLLSRAWYGSSRAATAASTASGWRRRHTISAWAVSSRVQPSVSGRRAGSVVRPTTTAWAVAARASRMSLRVACGAVRGSRLTAAMIRSPMRDLRAASGTGSSSVRRAPLREGGAPTADHRIGQGVIRVPVAGPPVRPRAPAPATSAPATTPSARAPRSRW